MRMQARPFAGLALLVVLATAAPAGAQTRAGPAYVTRVVDGVTLYAEIAGRLEAVRYLGVRVPRIDHPRYGGAPYADAAREANRRLVEGKWIRLVFETESRDRHGRLLAWVWRDDVFVNALLVHHGWIEAMTGPTAPRYFEYLHALEQGARQGGRGIWRDRTALAYHRPQPTDGALDGGDSDERAADASGGRVFSAPAPFALPPAPTTRTTAPPPSAAPRAPTPAPTGGTGYSGPPRSFQRTR